MTTVIVSGGLDSTVLYYWLQDRVPVKALHFRYGSRHEESESLALSQVIHAPIKELSVPFDFATRSSLMGHGKIPQDNYSEENLKSTIVPYRNGVLLSFAVAYAWSQDSSVVAIGAHHDDNAVYPDCRPQFVEAFSKAAELGTDSAVRVVSPFVLKTKADIVRIGHDLGIDEIMGHTWSCYQGGKIQCGTCSTCRARREAFIDAGVSDRTIYAH